MFMPKPRVPYPAELRRQILALVREGRTAWSLAGEFEPSAQTILNWIKQAKVDQGLVVGVSSDEKEEMARLRREVEILREEREILAKAAAWFAEETVRTPRGRSGS
jgi:transposase